MLGNAMKWWLNHLPKAAGTNAPAKPALASVLPAGGKDVEKKDKPVEVAFVLEGDHVKMLPVKRGVSDDAHVEITEGLEEGAAVISGGYKAINRELEDGKKVKTGVPDAKPDESEKK